MTVINKTKRQRLTASILTFVMLFQIIAGIFAPVNIFNLKKNEAHAGWYDAGYGYKKEIKVDHTKVANTDQTNFPILVSFIDPALKIMGSGGKVTNASGYDIIFTNASGSTKLDHEIEKYVPTTGEIVMWVKIPALSASVDTSIYIYYGNANITTTQENKTGVWGSNFAMVQHMNGSTTPAVGDFKDSTQYANNSTNNTNEPTVATGQVDGAQSFNGTSSYVDVGNGGSLNPTYVTAEAWIYPKTSALAYGVVLDKAYTSHTTPYYQYEIRLLYTAGNVTSIDFYLSSVVKLDSTSSVQSLSLNSWHYLVGTYDGSFIRLYVDGVLVSTKALTGNLTSFATNLQIGKFRNLANGFFSGSLDEVRISNTARSAGWIATEYNNQSQPTEFSTLGIEEARIPF